MFFRGVALIRIAFFLYLQNPTVRCGAHFILFFFYTVLRVKVKLCGCRTAPYPHRSELLDFLRP